MRLPSSASWLGGGTHARTLWRSLRRDAPVDTRLSSRCVAQWSGVSVSKLLVSEARIHERVAHTQLLLQVDLTVLPQLAGQPPHGAVRGWDVRR